MYGQIFARSDLREDGSGKTMRVWSDAEKLSFSVDVEKQLFVIQARCYERIRTGNWGGMPNEVNRSLHIELERDEVEKLIDTAVSKKLLKKLSISNLAKIDKVGNLERSNEKLREELEAANKLVALLQKKISRASVVLSSDV